LISQLTAPLNYDFFLSLEQNGLKPKEYIFLTCKLVRVTVIGA